VEPSVLIDPIPSDSILQIVEGEFAVEESTQVEPEITPVLPEAKTEDEIRLPGDAIDPTAPKLEVYPNPSSDGMITLKYTIPSLRSDEGDKGNVSVFLYDMNGNRVKTLLSPQSLYPSRYETRYDVTDFENGAYLIELVSGNNKAVRQIVISK
jgi:hypothetical protein